MTCAVYETRKAPPQDLRRICANAVAIFQDQEESPGLSRLARHVVYPAWLHGLPICFFSLPSRDFYIPTGPLSSFLHTESQAIERALEKEQMIHLVEEPGLPRMPQPAGQAPECGPSGLPPDECLDSSQHEAVNHLAGPMRVLAPAGSGKTRTIIHRICRLVDRGIDPETILPLAFNRKAAGEMNARLERTRAGMVKARTFHSFGYEIVREERGMKFDPEGDPARLLMNELLPLHTPSAGADISASALRLLSRVKTELLPLSDIALETEEGSIPFGPLFARYQRNAAARGIMDYDDMIYGALCLLLDHADLRRKYQRRCRYILVDEYQDLNSSQILLLKVLALPENNLFVVGDDDQAIYGWRGARAEHILNFPATFPCARECLLGTNYRSSGKIVTHAGWLIAQNEERVPKQVSPRRDAPPGAFLISVHAGLWEQAKAAAEWIRGEQAASGIRWGECAVLYRYNALQCIAALALESERIPHTPPDWRGLSASRVGRDLRSWLTVLLEPGSADPDHIRRIISRPHRLLPRDLTPRIEAWRDLQAIPGLGEFLARCDLLQKEIRLSTAAEFLRELDRTMRLSEGYRRSRRMIAHPDEADDATCLDVLIGVSVKSQTAEDFLAHLIATAADNAGTNSPGEDDEPCDGVTLSTIHKAKGREFSRVVCFDMSRRRRLRPKEIEEERRVAYVGLTRAMDALLATANGRRQSRFLREAALDPRFRRRMREDMESEIRSLALHRSRPGAAAMLEALEEELRLRGMLSMP